MVVRILCLHIIAYLIICVRRLQLPAQHSLCGTGSIRAVVQPSACGMHKQIGKHDATWIACAEQDITAHTLVVQGSCLAMLHVAQRIAVHSISTASTVSPWALCYTVFCYCADG